MLVNRQRSIGAGGAKAKKMKKRCNALVPRAGSLLEPVQGLGEAADVVWAVGVDEASGLKAEDLLIQRTMEECIGYVKLMNWPAVRGSQGEHGADGSGLDDRREGLAVVDAGALVESSDHQPLFGVLECAGRPRLVPENLFAGDDNCTRRPRGELPSAVAGESSELFTHGGALVGVA